MRILFTNDDGYDSIGLQAVADLFKDGYEIAVIAPDRQRSAMSHAMSTHTPFTCREVSGYRFPVYALGGTPVDCAKFGITTLFKKPDVIVSGINNGPNIGSDIMYSGTVGAAFEAPYFDCKGFALSLDKINPSADDYKRCAKFFYDNFDRLCGLKLEKRTMININFPSTDKPKGVKIARMSLSHVFGDNYDNTVGEEFMYRAKRGEHPYSDSDEEYCVNGYITITPLTMDQTDYASLKRIKREKFIL